MVIPASLLPVVQGERISVPGSWVQVGLAETVDPRWEAPEIPDITSSWLVEAAAVGVAPADAGIRMVAMAEVAVQAGRMDTQAAVVAAAEVAIRIVVLRRRLHSGMDLPVTVATAPVRDFKMEK